MTDDNDGARARGGQRHGGLLGTLESLFSPGPFAWVFRSIPQRHRFQPGRHMHGLDEHDVPVERVPSRGTGIEDLPRRGWSPDPPAR